MTQPRSIVARLSAMRDSKAYDFVMALPLIAWFGWGAIQIRPQLVLDVMTIASGNATLLVWLHFVALTGSALFNLLLVGMLVLRDPPALRSTRLLPRVVGFAGTFLSVAILHLPPVHLSLPWQAITDILIIGGGGGSALVLCWLGRAFSILPEARRLVVNGPYAYARHPLYAVELLTIVGIALQYEQPWAGLIGVMTVALLILRTRFEEQVLGESFSEYADYRKRVRRFGFI